MKRLSTLLCFMLAALLASAQDSPALAKRVVNETAGVKPGDVVWITCGRLGLDLAEQIAAEVDGGRRKTIDQRRENNSLTIRTSVCSGGSGAAAFSMPV